MRKVNDSINHTLRYVSENGKIYGQFYNSYDKKYHLAEYIPYHGPPRNFLCNAIGNASASRSEHEDRNKCLECFSLLDEKAKQEEVTVDTKQVIVVRKDLGMRRGKEIAQGAHASMAFLTRKLQPFLDAHERQPILLLSEVESSWINSSFKKVTLQVNSEEELLEIERKAKEAGLGVHVITDSGLTEFNGVPTRTCLAIGPDEEDKINAVTGHLKLY